MKKNFLSIVFLLLLLFVSKSTVKAGSLSIDGNNSVYLNSTITVNVKFNNIAGRFIITSSNQSVLSGNYEDFYDNQSVNLTFTAKSVGTATITVTPIGNVGDYDSDLGYSGGSRSLTINVVKKSTTPSIDVNPTYNKNNYLSSLSIEGYELTPNFDKETLEYTVTLEPGTENIVVNASVEDKTASVKGTGEVSVTEGINTINIVVTAENGNERTYKILATVEEKDPINVEIDGKNYTVVKKRELIGNKDGYIETTVKISEFEIPALYNEVTKVTLIGLKDEEGNIKLFSYDTKSGKYSEYKEFTFDLMSLYIHENKDSKYKKVNIKINDVDVVAYELEGIDDYYLLYATNTSTGHEGYYLYDTKENSVQRYDTTLLENITKEKDKYFAIVIVLSCVCFLTMLFLLIEINKVNKKNEE